MTQGTETVNRNSEQEAATASTDERRITGLAPDPGRRGAIRVSVNGRLFCTLPAGVVAPDTLKVGMPLNAALEERLGSLADAEAAYRTLLRALERRAYARGDLSRRLVQKGHPRAAVVAALDRAEAAGLVNDAAYVAHYVETRAARGRGPDRLRRDLLRLGVERSLIDRAITEHWPEGSDRWAMPRALADTRAKQLGDIPRAVKRRRLLTFLARRGFSGREVQAIVVRAVAGDVGSET